MWNQLHTGTVTCTFTPLRSSLLVVTLSALEAPSSHASTPAALITAHFPASPLTPHMNPGWQQALVCPERPPLRLFHGQACNPSPVRVVQCTNLGLSPAHSLSTCLFHYSSLLGLHTVAPTSQQSLYTLIPLALPVTPCIGHCKNWPLHGL